MAKNLTKQFCQLYNSKTLENLRKLPESRVRSTSNPAQPVDITTSTDESEKLQNILPIQVNGTVIHGFGRGSKELGIRTANYSEQIVNGMPGDFQTGIYYCWAQVVYAKEGEDQQNSADVRRTQILPAVMSVGWNPYYNNEKKSMETHVIHKFEEDWYDYQLRLMICGRIRGETNFTSLQALIDAIWQDVEDAKMLLESDWSLACKSEGDFFLE